MLDIVRWLLDWPRNSDGEVIFRNTHEAIFYAIMVKNIKALVEEIDVLKCKCKEDLFLEQTKPDANPDRMIQLACKLQFYNECIDTSHKLFKEE